MYWLIEVLNFLGELLEKSRYCKGDVNYVSL